MIFLFLSAILQGCSREAVKKVSEAYITVCTCGCRTSLDHGKWVNEGFYFTNCRFDYTERPDRKINDKWPIVSEKFEIFRCRVEKLVNLVPRAFSSWRIREAACQSGSKNSFEVRHVNAMKCLCFVWTTVSDCRKQTRPPRRWKQPPKKPFHHVSRDKILHDSWSISAALARGFSDLPFWTRRRP